MRPRFLQDEDFPTECLSYTSVNPSSTGTRGALIREPARVPSFQVAWHYNNSMHVDDARIEDFGIQLRNFVLCTNTAEGRCLLPLS